MASGNITVTTSNKYISGRLAWSSTTDTANNRSTVTATLYLSRTNTGYTTTRTPNITITINGNKKNIVASSQLTFKYNSNTNCGTYSVVVPHNTDGSKSCVISVSGSLTGGSEAYALNTASQTVTLNKIPRHTSITNFSATVKERNRIDISWKTANTCNYWWYSLNGGSSWVAVGTINASSGSRSITGLSAGKAYSLRVRVRRSDNNLTTDSGKLSRTTLAAAIPNTPTTSSTTCISTVVSWSSNRTVTAVQYRIGTNVWTGAISGGSFTARTSGSFTVPGRTPGTAHNVQVQVKDAVTGGWSGWSGNGKFTTVRLTTAGGPTFSTGNSLTVSLSRGSTSVSNDVTLQMWADSQKYINIATTTQWSDTVTFNLTEAQLNTIYSNRTGSKTSTVRLQITNRWGHGGTSQGTSYSSTGTCTIVNANPTIASVSYKDTNATIQGILNNNQKILRNLSTLQVTAGKATSQKYATLKSYKVSIGGGEYTLNTSGTSETGKIVNVGKVNQSANQTAVLTVTDSRGYTASKSFTVQMLDYLPPQFIQASANRLNNYEESSSLYINARHSIVKPDSTDVNNLKIRYRIKQNPSGSYGDWVNITIPDGTGSGLWNTVNIDQYLADYPNDKSYTIELGISDMFTTWNTILMNLPEGIALLRFFKDLIEVGVPIHINNGKESISLKGDIEDDRSWISFYDNDGDIRKGFIGFGDHDGNLVLYNDDGDIRLRPKVATTNEGRLVIKDTATQSTNTLSFPNGRKAGYTSTGGNANNIVDEWVLIAGSNLPSTRGYFYLHTILYSTSSQRLQLAYSYNSTNTAYMRHLYGGTWSNWTALHT